MMCGNKGLKVFRLYNIPSKAGKWGTILKIVYDEKTPTESLMVRVVTINPNLKIDAHYHNIEELQYILHVTGDGSLVRPGLGRDI